MRDKRTLSSGQTPRQKQRRWKGSGRDVSDLPTGPTGPGSAAGWMHRRAGQLRPMGPVEATDALAILLALGAFIWAVLIGLAAAAVIAGQLVLILVVGEPVAERLLRDPF